jgi:hypothetical protein
MDELGLLARQPANRSELQQCGFVNSRCLYPYASDRNEGPTLVAETHLQLGEFIGSPAGIPLHTQRLIKLYGFAQQGARSIPIAGRVSCSDHVGIPIACGRLGNSVRRRVGLMDGGTVVVFGAHPIACAGSGDTADVRNRC